MAVGHAYLPRGLAATVELLAVVLNRYGANDACVDAEEEAAEGADQ